MKYLLTVLANGRDEYLRRTLAAFDEFVSPPPADMRVVTDVPGAGIGMCAAHACCWQEASESEHDWVFHLEEDMVILRPINLHRLCRVLEVHEHLKQMALVRCPWGAEIEHGGFIPMSPGWYERQRASRTEWIETTRNWTNAPALYRTDLTREFEWPVEPGCETTIGPQILAKHSDAKFGLWGAGEPWCAHIGVERAVGAHGY